MTVPSSPTGDLVFGHLLQAAGVEDFEDVLAIRHTYLPNGIASPADATVENLIAYTRVQAVSTIKIPRVPPRLWVTFMADGARRSRLLTAYVNDGEILEQRMDATRTFALEHSDLLSSLKDRLVIEWSADAVNWAKPGPKAAAFPVVEIADPHAVPFPGFDNVRISYDTLQAVVDDSRYAAWRTALAAVQGVYLIADTSTGRLYVGKADGGERILGRWTVYARDGHGGNKALRELDDLDMTHRRHLQFSILRVFGPNAPAAEIADAESHYKEALLTRQFGLNRN